MKIAYILITLLTAAVAYQDHVIRKMYRENHELAQIIAQNMELRKTVGNITLESEREMRQQ